MFWFIMQLRSKLNEKVQFNDLFLENMNTIKQFWDINLFSVFICIIFNYKFWIIELKPNPLLTENDKLNVNKEISQDIQPCRCVARFLHLLICNKLRQKNGCDDEKIKISSPIKNNLMQVLEYVNSLQLLLLNCKNQILHLVLYQNKK